jgi:putative alpha-1,2-mannosidase
MSPLRTTKEKYLIIQMYPNETSTTTAWNTELAKLQVTSNGNDDDYSIFYTALYHALLSPTTWSDEDGRYSGYDQQIHTVPAGHQAIYANISGWDVYRSEIPLRPIRAANSYSSHPTTQTPTSTSMRSN